MPRYYQYNVSSNATAVAFELINPGGPLNMVASLGAPLPTESSYAYQTGVTTGDATILVASNSTPVALTPGTWYLGVFNHGAAAANYTVEAVEIGSSTNDHCLNQQRSIDQNFSPAQALTTFFEFAITNNPSAALFELYQMNGNVDLTLDKRIFRMRRRISWKRQQRDQRAADSNQDQRVGDEHQRDVVFVGAE